MRLRGMKNTGLSILTMSCLAVLVNNCSKSGFTYPDADPMALAAHAEESDFAVIDPDGNIVNSQKNSDPNKVTIEKVYWNGNGNSAAAPRWSGSTVNWYYNPANQPSTLTTSQALAAIQKSMTVWQSVCGIKWSYQGTTTRSTDSHSDQFVTIGWGDANGYTGGYTTVQWDGGLAFVDSDVEFSATGIRDANSLYGIANHELGHQLGLEHSDISEAIMFANPYHTTTYMGTLRTDDISGCVGLYGPSMTAPSPTPKPTPLPGYRSR